MIFIGNPGTGKTHLATAMGIKALMKGFKVLFTPVSEMLNTLNGSRADNSYYQKVAFYTEPNLLILDELGFKKLPNYSADVRIPFYFTTRSAFLVTTNSVI